MSNVCLSVLVAELCPTLCDPLDCSPPSFSTHGILQARTLKWVAIPFSKRSSWPRDQTWASCIAVRFFTVWAIRETQRMFRVKLDKLSCLINKRGLEKCLKLSTIGGVFYSSLQENCSRGRSQKDSHRVGKPRTKQRTISDCCRCSFWERS